MCKSLCNIIVMTRILFVISLNSRNYYFEQLLRFKKVKSILINNFKSLVSILDYNLWIQLDTVSISFNITVNKLYYEIPENQLS